MPEITYPPFNEIVKFRAYHLTMERVPSITIDDGFQIVQEENFQYAIHLGQTPVLIAFQDTPEPLFDEYLYVLKQDYRSQDFPEINFELIKKLAPLGTWIRHPNLDEHAPEIIAPEQIVNSWKDNFHFKESRPDNPGLRKPQIGAVYSLLAHWTTSNEPAVVVMPTGTGKTETMLSALVSGLMRKLVVVVPTDALRDQIAGKFTTLGWLKTFGIVAEDAIKPVVGVIKKIPHLDEIDNLFQQCNVIISTMAIFGRCDEGTQVRIADRATHLFIDEAHHTPADSWNNFKEKFRNRLIVQFTATPFRNDDKKLEGKVVYNYPLKKAQEEEYFKPINFIPISEYNTVKADEVIAQKAVDKLLEDLADGLDHILMARVKNIKRADAVFDIYARFVDLHPVKIYSALSTSERKEAKRKILNKEARIIVCVDMLGEGFDMPELKIAAFHDIKKSLAITLQLAGRFTRFRQDLGEATFIANIAETSVKEELEQLYQHDSDWNQLLPNLAQKVNKEQEQFWELIRNFDGGPSDYPIHQITPALSTVIYKSSAQTWTPDNFRNGLRGEDSYEVIQPIFNREDNVLVVVLGRAVPVKWGNIEDLKTVEWDLLIAYWNRTKGLLFIHASNTNSYYRSLAESIIDHPTLIRGAEMFRCFANINRLRLSNVGTRRPIGKIENYTMRVGSDIGQVISPSELGRVTKANIFGVGYEDGAKTSIGCSHNGRVWAMRVNNINTWMDWCNKVAEKITDNNIDPNTVLAGALIPKNIASRPLVYAFGIDWPEEIYKEHGVQINLKAGTREIPIWQAELELEQPGIDNELRFKVSHEAQEFHYQLELLGSEQAPDYRILRLSQEELFIELGTRRIILEEYLTDRPPLVFFVDGSMLEGNAYTRVTPKMIFAKEELIAWNWTGTNIRRESQGVDKDNQSIQWRVIEWLKVNRDYDVIIDDDDKGEVADIVCFKVIEDERMLVVDLFHCKYSIADNPGARVDDLYQVCGQAQKSIKWLDNTDALFSSLLKRNADREAKHGVSRIELGTKEGLEIIRKRARKDLKIRMNIAIVQPGLSFGSVQVQGDTLQLLGVVKSYLHETWEIPLEVIINE